jgi:hypothetical protein
MLVRSAPLSLLTGGWDSETEITQRDRPGSLMVEARRPVSKGKTGSVPRCLVATPLPNFVIAQIVIVVIFCLC